MISTSLWLFARLPLEVWRQLVGLLSFSDVAACSRSTSHEDTKWLLTGYMRRRCCVSTFKRLLAHYGAIIWDPDYGEKWDTHFWNGDFMRKEFWRLAIEMIFLYEPKMLQEGQRCDRLIQQDYIHSCGILFASEACSACSASRPRPLARLTAARPRPRRISEHHEHKEEDAGAYAAAHVVGREEGLEEAAGERDDQERAKR